MLRPCFISGTGTCPGTGTARTAGSSSSSFSPSSTRTTITCCKCIELFQSASRKRGRRSGGSAEGSSAEWKGSGLSKSRVRPGETRFLKRVQVLDWAEETCACRNVLWNSESEWEIEDREVCACPSMRHFRFSTYVNPT
jgi:hypothetical protein